MGFLTLRDPSPDKQTPKFVMTPPASSAGQGAVDRLATFFLSRLQETKNESELTTLQCTTQLRFEAAEKMLEGHTRTIAALRDDVQSFWDKAPSFFLHKFSAQLDALGAGRSEKSELAVARLERRVDDEVKNLADQLSDLSTKLAVDTTALSATVDDVAKKVGAGNEASTESVRRCESEFRSKLSRLESLLESNKTDSAIERDKINKTFQEASRRLQSKVDSLELTVMRQSEELTGQCEKIDRLEKELQKLSQRSIGQEKTHSSVVRMLSAQGEELARLGAQAIRPQSPPRTSRTGHSTSPKIRSSETRNEASSPTPRLLQIVPRAASPPFRLQSKTQAAATPGTAAGPNLSSTSVPQNGRPNGPGHALGHLKRPYKNPESFSLRPDRAQNAVAEPSPKRQRTDEGEVVLTSTEVNNTGIGMTTSKQVDVGLGRRQLRKPKPMGPLQERSPETQEANMTSRTLRNRAKAQSAPSKQQEEEKPRISSSPPVLPRAKVPQQQGELPTQQNKPSPRQDKEKPHEQEQNTKGPTSDQKEGPEQGRNDVSTPKKKVDVSPQATSPTRREAAMAFIAHVKKFALEFKASPPRSERQFIWRFLEGIPDPVWAEFVQKKLLEAYPSAVRPSLGLRARHPINFDAGLTWRHVFDMIRTMQQRSAS